MLANRPNVQGVCGFSKKHNETTVELSSSIAHRQPQAGTATRGSSDNCLNAGRCFVDGGNPRVPTKGEYCNSFTPSSAFNDCHLQRPSVDDNSIVMYLQNVRGLRTRIDDLYLTSTECDFDVIILTETGLDDSITSLQLFGSACNVFRCDRGP